MAVEKPKLDKSVRVPFTKEQKASVKALSRKLGYNSMSSYVRSIVTIELKEKGYLDEED